MGRTARLAGAVVTTLAAVLLLAACGGGDGGSGAAAETSPCATPTPGEIKEPIPKDLDLESYGTLIESRVKSGFLGAALISEQQIIELYPALVREVQKNYVQLAGENEGFEAEVFFQRGGKITATLLLREGPCDGLVTVRLVYGAKRFQ